MKKSELQQIIREEISAAKKASHINEKILKITTKN